MSGPVNTPGDLTSAIVSNAAEAATTPARALSEAPETLREVADAIEAAAAPPPVIVPVGIFEDGTRADWRDNPEEQTAVQRLAVRYVGHAVYRGGFGTDERGWWTRTRETLLGQGRRAKFADYREILKLIKAQNPGASVVLDLFGWSRGGDSAIEFVPEALELGVAVRFLGVFDPVPARGWKAAVRVVPLAKLPMWYDRPKVGSVCQVLAAENHSRITRHARIKIDPKTDAEMYVGGSHRDAVSYAGAYPEVEKFVETCAATAGVAWRKVESGGRA